MKVVLYKGRKLYLHNMLRLQTRRAWKLGIDPPNPEEVYLVFNESIDAGCHYCGCEFVPGHEQFRPTLDHIIPLSRGGTNELKNLTVCCNRCNLLKRTMTGHEFLSIMDKMDDYIQYANDDLFRNRFLNRFKELRDSPNRVYIPRKE